MLMVPLEQKETREIRVPVGTGVIPDGMGMMGTPDWTGWMG